MNPHRTKTEIPIEEEPMNDQELTLRMTKIIATCLVGTAAFITAAIVGCSMADRFGPAVPVVCHESIEVVGWGSARTCASPLATMSTTNLPDKGQVVISCSCPKAP